MIILTYHTQPFAACAPRHVPRKILQYQNVFLVDLVSGSTTYQIAHARMPEIRACVAHYRDSVDLWGYRSASYGLRFSEGNSYIETLTVRTVPVQIQLHFSDREDHLNKVSPSCLNGFHVRTLSHAILKLAPLLIKVDVQAFENERPEFFPPSHTVDARRARPRYG